LLTSVYGIAIGDADEGIRADASVHQFQDQHGTRTSEALDPVGEAQSKCEHLQGVPLPLSVQKDLLKIYLAKGVLATTAIEGNTLSEEDVKRLIDGQLTLPPSKEYMKTEVANVLAICNRLWEEDDVPILTVDLIRGFDASVLKDLPPVENVVPGRSESGRSVCSAIVARRTRTARTCLSGCASGSTATISSLHSRA